MNKSVFREVISSHPFLSREAARTYRDTVAAAKVTNTPTSSLSILFSAYHTPSAPARKISAHSWNNGSEQGGEKDADVRHRQPQEAGRGKIYMYILYSKT
jgi:hypothetical protein